MWVSDLKQNKDLPQEFLDLLPDVCECGSELVISESLTGLRCPNPFCLGKVVKRAEALLEDIGVRGLGESGLRKYFEYYGVRNPLELFSLEEGDLVWGEASPEVSSKIINQLMGKREMFLWQMVKYANIPNVQTTAKPLVEGYSSLGEFYNDLEYGGILFIKEKLGIGEFNDVMASKIFNSLMTYKQDLLDGEKLITVKEYGNIEEIEICISGGVAGYKSKNEFVEVLNKEFSGKYFFVNNSSLTKKAKVLVFEGGRVTSKAKTAERYGTPVMNGSSLLELLRNGGKL